MAIPSVKEPRIARYVVVDEGGFRIPDPLNDHHIQEIHAPGLVSGSNPVLFFRTRHQGGRPSFTVRFATTPTHLISHTFTDDVPVPWHKVIPAGMLKPQKNELIFSVRGEGVVDFGDIFILYMSNEVEISLPLVLDPDPN